MTMKIRLKLFATFREYLPKGNDGHSCTLDISEETRIEDLLNKMNIPKDIPKIIIVNGLQKGADEFLKDGDTLSVFPPVAGG